MPVANARKFPRYLVEVAAEVHIDGAVVAASTQNVSVGGAALLMDRALPQGSTVEISLFLTQDGIEDPDEEPFSAKGTVQWVAERDAGIFAAGVRFVAVSPPQVAHLERFVVAVAAAQS